ncbi:MAG: c-type cytochrome [Steroidobacteraceae bacterium]
MSKFSVARLGALAVLCWVGLFATAPASAQTSGDAARGERLAYTCLGCHGIPNYKNAYPVYRVPKLRGQSAEYLVSALQAYRSGERSHGTMHANASSLNDQDILDVAAYLAGPAVKPAADAKPVGTPPAAAAVCVSCHGTDGIGITPQYPSLAGQHDDYLVRALTDYKKGGRKNAIMAGFAAQLTANDIDQLAAYYSRQRSVLAAIPKNAFGKR